MLKNVAIPLMLAASEAEAQKKGALADALEGDLKELIPALQADAAACTVASSQAADNIANLAQAVSDKDAAKVAADKAVTDLKDAAGAWGLANTAREAAVQAAVAQEAASNIASLLDALDTAAEDERAKAALYVAADKLYQAGLRRQTAAVAANTAAQGVLGTLESAKTNAATAVQSAKDQHAKETLWRQWRYCELGTTVATAALPDPAKGWWQMLSGTYTVASPASCVVPAVPDAAGTGEARGAVTYYIASGASPGLTAESEDGTSKWNAHLVHTTATTAEAATSTFQAFTRNKAGEVAWYTGNLRQKQWKAMQRKREQTFYGSVNTARASAKAVATNMAEGATYDVPSSAPLDNMTASAAGAKKAMDAAATARDLVTAGASAGSLYHMPSLRTQSTTVGEEWKMTWGPTVASLKAWKTANTATAGATSLWWVKARDVTAAYDAWWTKWGTDSLKLTQGNAAFTETLVDNAGANGKCALTNTVSGGTWSVNAGGDANIAGCKTACEAVSVQALVYNCDTTSGAGGATTTATNGGATCPIASAASTTWCGGYSFDSAAASGSKCSLLANADDPVHSTADSASNRCSKMNTVKAFATAQAAVANGVAAVTSTLLTNMTTAADGQAALEKAWLQSWYTQQYWAALKVQLTETTASTKSKTFFDEYTNLGTSGTSDDTNVAGADAAEATATTQLNTATEQLATLQAATAAAAATVAALGSRILRADAQLAELDGLANAGATGTLDQAAKLRLDAYNEYNNDGSVSGSEKGAATLATEEKTAADLAVKARTGASTTDGGVLTEGRAVALANWTAAQGAATQAESNLTTALSGAVLATLRQTVEDDTQAWDAQQLILAGLITDAVNAEAGLDAAQDALDAAVMACQITAYDKYRTTLESEMVQRAADLKTIKALIEAEMANKPAPGTKGARCEKAISNGTYRPARGEQTCAEGLCCGAARVWMESGTTADAAWRTIETCQLATDTSYVFSPPRAPMATVSANTETVDFACIEGAKKLAAAASAVAAAVYMLA